MRSALNAYYYYKYPLSDSFPLGALGDYEMSIVQRYVRIPRCRPNRSIQPCCSADLCTLHDHHFSAMVNSLCFLVVRMSMSSSLPNVYDRCSIAKSFRCIRLQGSHTTLHCICLIQQDTQFICLLPVHIFIIEDADNSVDPSQYHGTLYTTN